MKDIIMIGDCQTDNRSTGRPKKLKEGDYLRMRLNLEDDDDDDTPGCMSLFRSRSSPHIDQSSCRSKSVDGMSPTWHYKVTTRIMKMFQTSHSDGLVRRKHKSAPAATGGCHQQQQQPRRRYMRVVTDQKAPPPDRPNDNPNIIPRYSQQYLAEYYEEKRTSGCDRVLPYVVSDNSILKKSSTDPTSNRRAIAALESTIGASEKHATFNDIVTVFDSLQHTVTEERLHSSVDSDSEVGDGERNFFLDPDSASPVAPLSQQSDVEEDSAVDSVDVVADGCASATLHNRVESSAMRNIFATFASPPNVLGHEMDARRPAVPALKQVDLKSVMEKSLAMGADERT